MWRLIRANFRLELISQPLESFAFGRIFRCKGRAQMVQRKIDVVQRIADLVGDGRSQPAHHRSFFDLMKLRLQFARASQACAIISLKAAASAPISSLRSVGTRTSKSPVATRRAATDKSLIGRVKRQTNKPVTSVVASNNRSVYRAEREACRSRILVSVLAELEHHDYVPPCPWSSPLENRTLPVRPACEGAQRFSHSGRLMVFVQIHGTSQRAERGMEHL